MPKLNSESVGKTYVDQEGKEYFIFKECVSCCSAVRYCAWIEEDTCDSYYAFNKQGQRLDHKGNPTLDSKFNLVLTE